MSDVKYVPYGAHMVSRLWWVILREADRCKIKFTVTGGHRTFAQQAGHRQKYLAFLAGGPWAPLAAKPTHDAPHIYTGRPNHALDINALDGGEDRFQRFLKRNGITAVNNVVGEAWHLFVPDNQVDNMWRFYRRILADNRKRAEKARKRRRRLRWRERKLPMQHTMEDVGIALVKKFEGFRARPYKPVKEERYLTIGYGHYGPDVYPGMVVNEHRATVLLRADLRKAEGHVRELVHVPLRKGEYNALVSFVFNVGGGAFAQSTLLRKVNQRHYKRAALEFRRWIYGENGKALAGLMRRRAAEAWLFLRKTPPRKG